MGWSVTHASDVLELFVKTKIRIRVWIINEIDVSLMAFNVKTKKNLTHHAHL
jgi:hypothetical protein